MGGSVGNGAAISTGAETWMLDLLGTIPRSMFMAALFTRTALRGRFVEPRVGFFTVRHAWELTFTYAWHSLFQR